MSIVSSTHHTLVPFKAGESKPLTGQRLCKVGYKNSKKEPAKYPSVCVSLPRLEDEQILNYKEALLPHLRSYLESVQDSIVRNLYESSEGNLSRVSTEEVGVPAIIGYLESAGSGHLKKEMIESWFDRSLKENLSVMIAEKLGTEDLESDQVLKHTKVYRDILSSLAGGKTVLTSVQIQGCKKALALSEDDDEMNKRLMQRLTAMETPKITEEMLEF